MSRIIIQTPDLILEKLLFLLTAEFLDDAVLLDAVWMDRIADYPGRKIIVFTASADPVYLTAARKAGADGFWYLKPSMEELSRIMKSDPAFPDHAPVVQLGNACSSDLTYRELEVLRELVTGKTDAEIGNTLNLAIPTVKHHVQQLFFKTGLTNRTQLAVTAVSSGMIDKKVTML